MLNYDNQGAEKSLEISAPEFLRGILSSSGVPLLVLDRDLKLVFFTPTVSPLFDVTASILGRPLLEITRRFKDDDILLDLESVIATGISLWREINTDAGACFDRRLLPHRLEGGDVQAIVMMFIDTSKMRAMKSELESARAYSDTIVDIGRQSLVVLDEELRVVSANPSFYRAFAVKPGSATGKPLLDIPELAFGAAGLSDFLASVVIGGDTADDYAIEVELPRHGRRILSARARMIPVLPPERQKILLAIDDITEWKQAEAVLSTRKKKNGNGMESLA